MILNLLALHKKILVIANTQIYIECPVVTECDLELMTYDFSVNSKVDEENRTSLEVFGF